ncbi:hypothetical protein ACNOYE_29955 [Nannocystaceae bacterium ST9]
MDSTRVLVALGSIALFGPLAGCSDTENDEGWTSFGQTTFTTLNEDDVDESGGESGDQASTSEGDTTDGGESTTTTTTTDGGESTTTTDDGSDCGNGVVDPGEGCDGANFNGQSCMGLGFSGGSLMCTADCQINSSGCTNGGGGGNQPADGLYSMCLIPEDCFGTDGCATVTMNGQVDPFDGYCTNFCFSDAECDLGLGGTAIPICNNELDPYCELVCTGGLTCPAPMQCVALADRDVCY